MPIFEFIAQPGLVIGTLIGIGLAVLLHWFFPTHNLQLIQLLIIVGCAFVGLVLESEI